MKAAFNIDPPQGQPQALFQSPYLDAAVGGYDVSAADGQRFITTAPVEQGEEQAASKVRIVLNWAEEFRDRQQ